MLRALATASCLALLSGVPARAQQALAQPATDAFPVARQTIQSSVLTVKQQALFEGSAFGKAAVARLEEATQAIATENRRIETDLAAEELRLTERRPTMTPEAFRPLADAFDQKVEGIRNAQNAKSRDLSRQRDEAQQKFFEYVVPVLAQLMQEFGATVLLDQSTVVLSLDQIDITDEAIARVDALTNADPPDGTPRAIP